MASWGKCDFSDLKRFQKKMEKMANADVDKFCREVSKELTARLLKKVIEKTPVGHKPKIEGSKTEKVKSENGKTKSFLTKEGAMLEKHWDGYKGGTLRQGWTAKTQSEAEGKAQALGGSVDTTEFLKTVKINSYGGYYVIEIMNPVEYADYVESGHRQTPGRYVPAIGKKLVQSFVPGRNMLKISIDELNAQKDAVIEKKLMEFLKKAMDNN